MDVHLALALLIYNINVYRTTRKNTLGILVIILAIRSRFKNLLEANATTTHIIKGLVMVTVWRDEISLKKITFISTRHDVDDTTHIIR